MLKRIATPLITAAALAFVLLAVALAPTTPSYAQPERSLFVTTQAIASAVAASGAASSVRSYAVPKTYQVYGSTTGGSGSAVVAIEGSMDSTNWTAIGSAVTLTLGTAITTGGFDSTDRYKYVRTNATTLTGTGAKYTATMGY